MSDLFAYGIAVVVGLVLMAGVALILAIVGNYVADFHRKGMARVREAERSGRL